MSTGYEGHIVAIECDDDMGRHWRTFDCTSPVTGKAVAAAALRYTMELSDAGELSDIDCTTDCPCVAPSDDCEQCESVGAQCVECWADARAMA
jgi:hypothetical protein